MSYFSAKPTGQLLALLELCVLAWERREPCRCARGSFRKRAFESRRWRALSAQTNLLSVVTAAKSEHLGYVTSVEPARKLACSMWSIWLNCRTMSPVKRDL